MKTSDHGAPSPVGGRSATGRAARCAGWLAAGVLLAMTLPVGHGAAEALRALKEDWDARRQGLVDQRQAAVEARLSAELDWANDQLERARMTRNVSQQALAHSAIRLFEEALGRVRARQPADLPERTTRRDLQGRLDAVRQTLAEIDREHRADLAALQDRIAVQVRPLAGMEDAALDDPRLMEALDHPERFVRTAPAPVPETPRPKRETEPTPPGREVGSSGEAGDWLPLLTITVATSALEVVTVPVVEVRAEQERRGRGAASFLEVVIRTTPERVLLPSDPPPVFRTVEVPGHPTPDVLRWPSSGNNWMLELRCRPQRGSAAPPALRLDVSAATARVEPLTRAQAEPPD